MTQRVNDHIFLSDNSSALGKAGRRQLWREEVVEMDRLSAEEVRQRIETMPELDRLCAAYAYSSFAGHAFFSADFSLPHSWADAIVLTDFGKEAEQLMASQGGTIPAHVLSFTLFRLFYHRELFIDYRATDLASVESLMQEMIMKKTARWPYVFGNTLYTKFNDTYSGNQTDSLDATDVDTLLTGTPQGVFQMGTVLSGPLGFCRSLENRVIYPTLKLPLWHCSDPGCRATHFIKLQQHRTECDVAMNALRRVILDNWGAPSDWGVIDKTLCERHRYPFPRPYSDLSTIIADCLLGSERAEACLRALRSKHNSIFYDVLSQFGRGASRPSETVESLSPEEQHQLLLLLPDREIVHFVDELICGGKINIPPTELRESKTYAPARSQDSESQLSSLGLRSASHPPIVGISALIWSSYEKLGMAEDLKWRLRGYSGSTLQHSVMDFVRSQGPEKTVKELILPSREVTSAIGESLVFQMLPGESDEMTCSRILWKMGFNRPRYEAEYSLLRKRLAEFRERVLQMPKRPSENDCASIRSSGVNLFVSIELLLENLICYNTWLMASDHFTGTVFAYAKHDAMKLVLGRLGPSIESGEQLLHWNTDGNNSIGTLVAYLCRFGAWLKERSTADKAAVERAEADYPHYAQDTLWVFPFKHVELWADTAPGVMTEYVQIIDQLIDQISHSDLAGVRNGLDHKRDDNSFPTSDRMLACESRLQKVIELVEYRRLVPKLYWCVESEMDGIGNQCRTFADYNGNRTALQYPSPVLPGLAPRFAEPYLIAPFDFLGIPNSMLIFRASSRTPYQQYWKDYPRRRSIPSVSERTTVTAAGNTNGERATAAGGAGQAQPPTHESL